MMIYYCIASSYETHTIAMNYMQLYTNNGVTINDLGYSVGKYIRIIIIIDIHSM